MTKLPTITIDQVLGDQDDQHDGARAAVRSALDAGDPGARAKVFELANQIWATVATAAWNEGERSPEIMAICFQAKQLCDWVYQTPLEDGEERYDVGGSVTTAGMMQFILGDTDGAIELFRKITARPVNSYFHESTYEKLIGVLIKDGRSEEAMVEVEALLASYPHNTFGIGCRDAYAHDAAASATAAKIDADTYGKVTTALSEQFSADMEKLMGEGLSQAELQVRMNDANKAFQSTMELLSRLL